MENTITWFTRYGTEYTGQLSNVDPKKGTASYVENRACCRCGGAGRAEKWKFTGYTCFDCGGSGKHRNGPAVRKAYTAEKLAKLNATKDKALAKRLVIIAEKKAAREVSDKIQAEIRRQESDAWKLGNADLMDGLNRYTSYEYVDGDEDGYPNFFAKMLESISKYGKLTDKQAEASRQGIAREDAKRQTNYVGECGKRIEMTVNIEKVFRVGERGMWGQRYMFLCRDENGNRIVYSGTGYLKGEGNTCRVKATVSGHECYRGEKQTIISRPKILEAAI